MSTPKYPPQTKVAETTNGKVINLQHLSYHGIWSAITDVANKHGRYWRLVLFLPLYTYSIALLK